MTDKVFKLTIVRHGQTAHNRSGILQGQLDTQLNDFGREQASLLRRYIQRLQINFDQVFSSDLSRAYETARIICGGDTKWSNSPSTIKQDPLLRERSYGKLEGLPLSTIREMEATKAATNQIATAPLITPTTTTATTTTMITNTNANENTTTTNQRASNNLYKSGNKLQPKIHRPEGGETLEEVQARVQTFCEQILFPNIDHKQHILIVSHGGTIREFMKFFKYKYGAQISSNDLVLTPNTGVNEFNVWLKDKEIVEQIDTIHLHDLPHLTFDVFDRNNPHVNLNNCHMTTAIQLNRTDKRDLKELDRLGTQPFELRNKQQMLRN